MASEEQRPWILPPVFLQCCHVRRGPMTPSARIWHVSEKIWTCLLIKCTNVIYTATTVPAGLQPSKIFTSLSLAYSLFPHPQPLPSLSVSPSLPSITPSLWWALSHFSFVTFPHGRTIALTEFTLSLCLSLSLPSSPAPPPLLATTLLDPEGITLSEPNVPQTCQMMFVLHPFPRASFSACVCFNSVYIFDKVLWHAPHSHVNRMKICSVIIEIGICRGGEKSGGQTESQGLCDNKVCMFRQLVSIFVQTISKQPFCWGSLETLSKGYFAENQRCLRDWTAAFSPPKPETELHRETNSLSNKLAHAHKIHFTEDIFSL